jgi:hypothetical protein
MRTKKNDVGVGGKQRIVAVDKNKNPGYNLLRDVSPYNTFTIRWFKNTE